MFLVPVTICSKRSIGANVGPNVESAAACINESTCSSSGREAGSRMSPLINDRKPILGNWGEFSKNFLGSRLNTYTWSTPNRYRLPSARYFSSAFPKKPVPPVISMFFNFGVQSWIMEGGQRPFAGAILLTTIGAPYPRVAWRL